MHTARTIAAGILRPLAVGLAGVCCLGSATARAAATDKLPPSAERKVDFWSFMPPVRPPLPKTKQTAWVRTPIDRFILSRLEKDNLAPAPEADRVTLMRRLSFDLLGLPPTPKELDGFVHDRNPDAWEKLVDRMLASPRYGERWARHWLDAVRFAESHGFEMNQPRPNAWPYRDYVVRAFNEDKPYNQFVLEQLAGDAVGADEATGFLVGGAWDQVKSPDVQLTLQQRADELNDMTATTGSAFLGLTVGCARCHDHKFDPIAQRDYYSLQAIFAGVQHGERAWHRLDETRRQSETESVRRALAALDPQLERFEPLAQGQNQAEVSAAPANQSGPNATQSAASAMTNVAFRPAVNPLRNVDRFAPAPARFVRFTITATTDAEPCLDELEIYAAGETPRNVALAAAGAKTTASGTLPNFAQHKLEHLNDGRYGNSRSWISDQKGKGWVQIELPATVMINRAVWGRDREGTYTDRLATKYRIEVAVDPGQWKLVASSNDRHPYKAGAPADAGYSAAGMAAGAAAELQTLLTQQRTLEARLAELTAAPMIYAGRFETAPPPTYRLYRGDPMQKRELLAPSGISAVLPNLELPADTSDQRRRLALGRWICDPQNPLTARVIVNRLWQHHFGQGLVNTPSDFGHMGDRPSHPELLDWLATELVANGWHLKPIQRLILLSAAYRQSSSSNPRALKLDASNRLLWRFTPQRLEAEEIRDAILATSGKLDLRMGGPGFDLFEPNNNYVRVYNPRQEFGPAEWRRMIYQFKPRMQQDAIFGAFDCPDGAQIAPRRNTSITPLQALNLLNSGFIIRQSEFLAARLRHEAGADPDAQVRRAFQLAFSRAPARRELVSSARFIHREGLAAFCRALFNANEFMFVY
ncbi:MAG: DUF1549 and DUF1553 domain-containing protein [Limisphaerales bacterium]